MKQFTIYENKMDEKPDWSRFRNVDLADISKTEFQGLTPFELPSSVLESSALPVGFIYNFKPRAASSTSLTISPGYVANGIPTIGGTAIDDPTPPALTVSASTLTYVYVCVNYTLVTTGSTVISANVNSRVISAQTSLQTSTNTDRYFLLFSWQAGRVVNQYRFYSFDIICNDNGTSTSTPTYRTWIS